MGTQMAETVKIVRFRTMYERTNRASVRGVCVLFISDLDIFKASFVRTNCTTPIRKSYESE